MNAALSTMITSPSWFRGRKIPSNRCFSSWQRLKLSVLWMKWVEKEIALGAPLTRFQYDASDKDDNGKKLWPTPFRWWLQYWWFLNPWPYIWNENSSVNIILTKISEITTSLDNANTNVVIHWLHQLWLKIPLPDHVASISHSYLSILVHHRII